MALELKNKMKLGKLKDIHIVKNKHSMASDRQ